MRVLLPSDAELVALLQKGGVGVIPTDTVYGLAARAGDREAVARLYALKDREHKPGTLIAADAAQAADLGLDETGLKALMRYWPGPLSGIVAAPAELGYLHQDVGSVAVRVPADESLRALLRQTGPLLTTSANAPGQPPATNLAEAQGYFGERVDFYVDGGDRSGRAPSTIVRIQDGRLHVVRAGAQPIQEGVTQ